MPDLVAYYALAVAIGLVAGSAITALADAPVAGGWSGRRSRCSTCGTSLGALDLVPVASFVALRGCCRHCGEIIPRWHVWTELAAVGLFALVVFLHPGLPMPELLLLFAVLAVLLALTITDIRFWILPDLLVGALAILAVVRIVAYGVPTPVSALIGGVAGLVLLGGISLFSGGRAMGLGDGKLAGAMGVLLGWELLLVALSIAFLAGGAFGGVLIAAGRATRKSHVPFGPFLALGTATVLLVPAVYETLFRLLGIVYS